MAGGGRDLLGQALAMGIAVWLAGDGQGTQGGTCSLAAKQPPTSLLISAARPTQ